jgi:hypothetical protein
MWVVLWCVLDVLGHSVFACLTGGRSESGNGRTDRCVMSVRDRRTTGDGERVA